MANYIFQKQKKQKKFYLFTILKSQVPFSMYDHIFGSTITTTYNEFY